MAALGHVDGWVSTTEKGQMYLVQSKMAPKLLLSNVTTV